MRGPLGKLRAKLSKAYGGEKIPLDGEHPHEEHAAVGSDVKKDKSLPS
ncbi:hypothetical protein Aros01_09018 [Streptosporangium roseum]